jgi:hypothetical protein
MNTLRKTIAAAAATSALLGTAVIVSTPAQAAAIQHCSTSSKTFALPGKPDVKVSVQLCVKRTYVESNGYRHYRAWANKVTWDGTSWFVGGKRFNDFSILPRLEHGKTRIQDCDYGICGHLQMAGQINQSEHGTYYPKVTVVDVKTKAKSWTADGFVDYDISDDGKPTKTWQLSGTSSVS